MNMKTSLRLLAQKAATVKEAVRIVKQTPRLRGAALVIGQAGDARAGVSPDAVVVSYDAAKMEVAAHTDGLA